MHKINSKKAIAEALLKIEQAQQALRGILEAEPNQKGVLVANAPNKLGRNKVSSEIGVLAKTFQRNYAVLAVRAGSLAKVTRVKLGYSQTEFARFLGLDQSAICRVENGNQHLTAWQLLLITRLYGTTVESLLDERFNISLANELARLPKKISVNRDCGNALLR